MDTSDLAKRMKDYEMRDRYFLQKRIPVAIRVDMRAGHTFTRGFKKPFDNIFMKSMQETAKYMCENMGNAKFAYVQSDEITIILVDYDTLETDCWFNYRTDKLCSISASMATMAFNKCFIKNIQDIVYKTDDMEEYLDNGSGQLIPTEKHYANILSSAAEKGAMFDARAFNIPKEEVTNLIYWRQVDAKRNSIQSVGQAYFSHKELDKKSSDMIQCMLFEERCVNWNDYPTHLKRGSCCVKNKIAIASDGVVTTALLRDTTANENGWIIDNEIPIFKGEGRKYIDNLIFIGED